MQQTLTPLLALGLALGTATTGTSQELAGGPTLVDPAGPSGSIAINRGGQILLLDAASGRESVLVADNTYARPLYWLPGGDRLVYWNHDGGAWDLWAIDPDTKKAENLTRTARDNRSPCASPDRSVIAFHRGGEGVWLMNLDGSDQRQLHERGHRDIAPVWSPSGRMLAFTDLESLGDRRVAMTSHAIALENGRAAASQNLGRGEVGFFLDEHRLVVTANYERAGERARELVVVDVRTGERRALTKSAAYDSRAVLAPDRRSIAWIEHAPDGSEAKDRLMIMNVDGSKVRELARLDHFFAPPSFSHCSRFLTYESGSKRGATQVYMVATNAPAPRQLTTEGGSFPVWSPRPPRAR